jgi:hypothetical protein
MPIVTLPVAVHPFSVAVTVYVPAIVEVSAALAGPFDHAKVEPEVAVAPKDTGVPLHPDVSGLVVTVGFGLITNVSGAEVAEPHVPESVTEYIPDMVGVMAWVVALVLHVLPVAADDVSVTLPLPHTVSGPPAVIVGVGVAAWEVILIEVVPVHEPLLTVTEYVLAEVTDIEAAVAPPGDHE